MRYSTLLSRHFARRAVALLALSSSFALAFANPPASDNASDCESQPADAAPLSPELQAALRDFLNFDPARMSGPATPLRVPSKGSAPGLDWNRTDKPDGSAAVTVKKPLPTQWDTNIGADFGLAAPLANTYQPDRAFPSKDQGAGAAWAKVTSPGGTSVDARVDPSREQRKLGTTLSHSLPIGSDYSVTLQNSFVVTETLGGAPTAPAIPGSAAPATSAQIWSTDRLLKFNIKPTGTTLAAGTTSSTGDSVLHNKISAEQKIFESFNITTAVTDFGGARPSSKSISAGFKLKW